jgi:hypothetical protein
MVPQRITSDGVTNVALTFDGESCTLRAVPKPETLKPENVSGSPTALKDDEGGDPITRPPEP